MGAKLLQLWVKVIVFKDNERKCVWHSPVGFASKKEGIFRLSTCGVANANTSLSTSLISHQAYAVYMWVESEMGLKAPKEPEWPLPLLIMRFNRTGNSE